MINGESWGVYVNAQQFNKDFTRDFFKSDEGRALEGARQSGGRGGLEYLGDDARVYKRTLRDQDQGRSEVVGRSDRMLQAC